jgi:hypothetical protein
MIAVDAKAELECAEDEIREALPGLAESAPHFERAGRALERIAKQKLYRAAKFKTFQLYCEKVWGFSGRYARYLRRAAQWAEALGAAAERQGSRNESQARAERQMERLKQKQLEAFGAALPEEQKRQIEETGARLQARSAADDRRDNLERLRKSLERLKGDLGRLGGEEAAEGFRLLAGFEGWVGQRAG